MPSSELVVYRKIYILLSGCLLLLTLLVDCRCNRSEIVINQIILEMSEELMKVVPEKNIDALRLLVGKAIDENADFRIDERADGLILKISLFPKSSVGLKRNAMIIVNLIAVVEGKTREQSAFADVVLQNDQVLDEQSVEEGLRKALAEVQRQSVGKSIDTSTHLAKLTLAADGQAVDAQDLMNSISLLARQKDRTAVPLLIKILLHTDNIGIGNACLIALGEIKDPAGMQAIIDFAEHKPALLRRQAIIAARQIGSKLAAEWLLVMAYGHEDPQVRKEAAEALAEVESHLERN